jgi:predicted O-methyltransferase YrrM
MLGAIRRVARAALTGKPMPYSGLDLINQVLVASGRKSVSVATWNSWLADLQRDAVMADAYERAKPFLAAGTVSGQKFLVSWPDRLKASVPLVEVFYMMMRALKPTSIVETGVAFGMTSSLILAALQHNGGGRLLSIDIPNVSTPSRVGNSETGILVPDAYRSKWELVMADAVYELPARLKGNEVDIFVHDSAHDYSHMAYEYCLAAMHLPHNGIIISDDILWNSAFVDVMRGLRYKTVSHDKNPQFGIAVVTKDI